MAPSTVRICVCGDESTGKSSLITSLVKDVFVTNRIQPVLPQITLPPTLGTPDNVTTVIVDTSALPQERDTLRKEVRKCNVILLVYSDHYSYERVALFWMPYFRSLGVNVPVVLCANKADLVTNQSTPQVVEDEMLPVMAEFKEIDSCIRTSAREHHNINEVFFLCQKAVTHPIAPLFDSKESTLKSAAITALQRIFYLCDKDQDGILNDEELRAFQMKVFEKSLSEDDLRNIKASVQGYTVEPTRDGIDVQSFIQLNKMFVEKGRHETLWIALRKFYYTDSLSLQDSFLHPKFEVPSFCSAELSPIGYRFFVDLFLLFDKDNDGGLNDQELGQLFAPTPGLPASWIEADFPLCTVRNDAGHITLQGWLAQWSMTTFEEPKTTLEYLAYLGLETTERGGITAALKITKARKRRKRPGRVERNVVLCYVLGASHSGKSSLLSAFLNRPFEITYNPTLRPRIAVNSVELQGGKQCYLILEELGHLESAILENQAKLDACDLLCYAYDSSDADSFAHIVELRKKNPHLDELPAVYAALKADQDKTVQRSELQPDQYTTALSMAAPLHVSVTWGSVSEFFVHLAESATFPSMAFPKKDEEQFDRTPLYIALGATACAVAAFAIIWKKNYYSTPSSRARDAEQRRGHVTQISISDPSHHVTDAIAHMYGDNDWRSRDQRTYSFNPSPPKDETFERRPAYFDKSYSTPPRESALTRSISNEKLTGRLNGSPMEGHSRTPSLSTPPPQLTRTPSSDTASQRFPLNDIDYESSPAAVAQELSNLQAIRRMSMNVDAADPDLPTFSLNAGPTTSDPFQGDEEGDPSRLFWVPARLHPELAPKEFKTFVEDRVDLIRRKSKKEDTLSPGGLDGREAGGNLRRRKSRLSKTIDSPIGYEDGAEVLERRRSQPDQHVRKKSETTLQELEHLVNDPVNLVRTLSLEARRSLESSGETVPGEGVPVLTTAAGGQALKRSTRTNYRRGSLRKGERVLPPRRANRFGDDDLEDPPSASSRQATNDDPFNPLIRVQTEAEPPSKEHLREQPRSLHKRHDAQSLNSSISLDSLPGMIGNATHYSKPDVKTPVPQTTFQSRLATHGWTTASLPGYQNPQNVPRIIETPPPLDNKQPKSGILYGQILPERKSSHEVVRASTMQTVPLERPPKRPDFTRSRSSHQTLDDMANNPSLMPGTSTRTDALSFIPTFAEEKKPEKKSRKEAGESSSRKGAWGWFLGSDDKDKEKERREKEEKEAAKKAKSKVTKVQEKSYDSTRLDLLQTATEGSRGRESLVLDRESMRLDDERKKDSGRKSSAADGKKEKEPGLFSSIFGGAKKRSDRDAVHKKAPIHRSLSPDPPYRNLRADIDYNWTRFSILEERAIYRMAHIKLANPRRALYSQVLLSNFMYSYLAKVQQMHPQIQIPQYASQMQQQQQQRRQMEEVKMREQQSDEFAQWQAYQNHHDSRVSYNNDGGTYEQSASNAQPYNSRTGYMDDYDAEPHSHGEAWAYQQGNGNESWDHHLHQPPPQQQQHWEQRDQYLQQGSFSDIRPPEDADMW